MLEKLYYILHRRASSTDERGSYSAGYWEGFIRSRIVELCGRSTGRLLELGCGEGLFLKKLLNSNQDISFFGLDHAPGMLSIIQEKLLQERGAGQLKGLVRADAGLLPFKDASFETVVCTNVFLNIPAFEVMARILAEMARVCAPGGRVIFDFRNIRNPFIRYKFKFAPLYDKTLGGLALQAFDAAAVRRCLDDLNMRIIEERDYGFPARLCPAIIIIEAVR